ncbi:MAG: hypothetical protein WAX69_21150 [Victivallales bacterium]
MENKPGNPIYLLKKYLLEITIFTAVFWLYAGISHMPNVNEISRIALTISMVDRGTLDIDQFQKATIDKSFRNGHYYSDKAPGLSFLSVPVYGTYKFCRDDIKGLDKKSNISPFMKFVYALWFTRAFTVSLVSAIFAVLFIKYLLHKGVDTNFALVLGLGYSLGTIASPYSTVFYGHQPAAVFLFTGFILAEGKFFHSGWTKGPFKYFICGLLGGMAFVTEFPTLLISGVIYVYMVANEWENALPLKKQLIRQIRKLIIFSAGFAIPLLLLFGYNSICFGNPLSLGYSNLASEEFRQGMSRGLFGIEIPSLESFWGSTFGLRRGLFVLSPFIMLFLPSLLLEMKRLSETGKTDLSYLSSLMIVIIYFIFSSSYHFWHGGDAIGPRHFIPALPFLVFLMLNLKGRKWLIITSVLVIISVFFMTAVSITDPQVSSYGKSRFPLFDESISMFLQAKTSITPFLLYGIGRYLSLVLFVVPPYLILISLFFWKRPNRLRTDM